MNRHRLCKTFALLLLSLASLFGQEKILIQPLNPAPTAAREMILRNSMRVKLAAKLDRLVYMAGESMSITLTVFNPTRDSLEVFDPFDQRAAGLDVMKWGHDRLSGPDDYQFVDPEPLAERLIPWAAPTVFISPGQTLEKHVRSFDKECDACSLPLMQDAGAPTYEGNYRLRYGYAGFGSRAGSDFRVQFHILRMVRSVALPYNPTTPNPRTGQKQERPVFIRTAVLQLGDEQMLVLSRGGSNDAEIPAKVGNPLDREAVRYLNPFDRIEETEDQLTILELNVDTQGNVTLRWKRGEQMRDVNLDKARSELNRF